IRPGPPRGYQAWTRSCAAIAASTSKFLTCCTRSSSAAGGRAPAWLNTSLPFLNAISVGMERMSAAAASCCSASVSTFACTTSGCCSEEAANVGANDLHGPHHDAQKSTNTMALSVMVSLNCSAVMSRVVTIFLTLVSSWVFPPYDQRKPRGGDQRKSLTAASRRLRDERSFVAITAQRFSPIGTRPQPLGPATPPRHFPAMKDKGLERD